MAFFIVFVKDHLKDLAVIFVHLQSKMSKRQRI